MDRMQKGLEVIEAMLPPEIAAGLRAGTKSTAFGAARAEMTLDFVYGELWSRPGLDRRGRSLVTLGILIALGNPEELRLHVFAALRNGCTIQEIEEALHHSAAYAGFPAARVATEAARDVLKKNGLIDD